MLRVGGIQERVDGMAVTEDEGLLRHAVEEW